MYWLIKLLVEFTCKQKHEKGVLLYNYLSTNFLPKGYELIESKGLSHSFYFLFSLPNTVHSTINKISLKYKYI